MNTFGIKMFNALLFEFRGGSRREPRGHSPLPSPYRIYKKLYIVNKKCIL
jgi:hypothetical protein